MHFSLFFFFLLFTAPNFQTVISSSLIQLCVWSSFATCKTVILFTKQQFGLPKNGRCEMLPVDCCSNAPHEPSFKGITPACFPETSWSFTLVGLVNKCFTYSQQVLLKDVKLIFEVQFSTYREPTHSSCCNKPQVFRGGKKKKFLSAITKSLKKQNS